MCLKFLVRKHEHKHTLCCHHKSFNYCTPCKLCTQEITQNSQTFKLFETTKSDNFSDTCRVCTAVISTS